MTSFEETLITKHYRLLLSVIDGGNIWNTSLQGKCKSYLNSTQQGLLFFHMRRFPKPQHFLLQSDNNEIFGPPGRPLNELNITFVPYKNLALVDLGFEVSKFPKKKYFKGSQDPPNMKLSFILGES